MEGAITIKIGKDQTVAGQAPDVQESSREPGKPTVQQKAVTAAIINTGKQVLIQGVNQYADLTGNYAMAESINTVLSIASDVSIIAAAGPIGAIAVATKYGMNAINSHVAQTRARQDIDLQRQRAGFVSTQGSRYGR